MYLAIFWYTMMGFGNVRLFNACSYCILSSIMALPTVDAMKKYCSEDYCSNSKQHTLCNYQSVHPPTNCVDYANIVTEYDKSAILNKINNRRNKVAAGELSSLPSAENMLKMAWSEELATSAQRWANQCVQHNVPDLKDPCRNLGSLPVGQNIATVLGDAPGLTVAALVDVWYTELLNLNASIIAHYRPSTEVRSIHYDYFTQLVWANSYEVGCGGIKFKVSGPGKSQTVQRLVCNFAPAGNRVGEPVYGGGAVCSRCQGPCDDSLAALCLSDFTSTTNVPLLTPIPGQNTNILPIDRHAASIISQIEMTSSVTQENATAVESDELLPVFDYFSRRHKFTNQEITVATDKPAPCKIVLAVDELLELFKKKLSSDPAMKDLLSLRKYPDQTDNGFTDAGVAAFISRLYSKKEIATTTQPVDKEYINSTLLADLVEAVIFRGGERYSETEKLPITSSYSHGVSPIRIQAELAKVKINNDFTGHYFFPQEEEQQSSTSEERIDAEYYTVTEIPFSDVVLELEDIKRNTAFTDFVDEILESETGTEVVNPTQQFLSDSLASFDHIGRIKMNKFLEEIPKENDKPDPAKDLSATSDEVNVQN